MKTRYPDESGLPIYPNEIAVIITQKALLLRGRFFYEWFYNTGVLSVNEPCSFFKGV